MVRRCMCGWHACMKTDGRTPCSRRSQRLPGRAKPPPADTPCLPVHPSSLSLRLPRSQHPPPCHTAKRARWDGDQAASAATRPVVDGPLPMLPTPSPQAPLPRAVAAFQTAPKPFSAEGWAHMLRGELSGPSAQVPAAGAPRAPAAPAAPFAPGDVVWAKLPTFPWWPAQVQAPETKQGRVSGRAPGTVFVVFYGRSGGGGRGEASSLGPGGRGGTRTVPREGELHGCGERAATLPDGTPCTGSLHRQLSAAPFLFPPRQRRSQARRTTHPCPPRTARLLERGTRTTRGMPARGTKACRKRSTWPGRLWDCRGRTSPDAPPATECRGVAGAVCPEPVRLESMPGLAAHMKACHWSAVEGGIAWRTGSRAGTHCAEVRQGGLRGEGGPGPLPAGRAGALVDVEDIRLPQAAMPLPAPPTLLWSTPGRQPVMTMAQFHYFIQVPRCWAVGAVASAFVSAG